MASDFMDGAERLRDSVFHLHHGGTEMTKALDSHADRCPARSLRVPVVKKQTGAHYHQLQS